MLIRQIVRYCRPLNVEFGFGNRKLCTINVSRLNKGIFSHNFKSPLYKCISNKTNGHLYVDHENSYAFQIIQKNNLKSNNIKTASSDITSKEDFEEILDKNWRDSTVGEVVNTFSRVKNYCILNNINVCDTRFDKLVDGLMDNCEQLTDDELITLLHCLADFPLTGSYSSHNFHDIWSCLDDICCWKITEWDIDTCFNVANAWYKLHLGKLCDYIYTLIDRHVKKADTLTKEQLVNIYFCFNICRKRAVDFEYEFALEHIVKDMDVDEMGVVAMGYFKTKTKIKLVSIHEAMANKVKENSRNINEVSLTAILKILRYSKPLRIVPKIQEMTEKLHPEIDRLSELSCIHLALLSTAIQVYNKNVLEKVSEKIVKNITNPELVRIKDIERILNTLTMFNFTPKTNPDIYKASYEEIHKNERLAELVKYPKCLVSSLNYLSLRNIYPYELINKLLDEDYISSTYGKRARMLPRDIFSLDCSVDIECPDYKGNRLSLDLKYKAAKWLTEFTPTYDQWKKLSKADTLVLDIIDTVRSIVGGDKFMHISHILPHFTRADIVVCKNKKTGKFVEPVGFHNYILGDVMVPYNDGSLEWLAVVVLGWNNTLRDSSTPLGHLVMKERQLKKIGYNPIFVPWREFLRLSNDMREEYILGKLRSVK